MRKVFAVFATIRGRDICDMRDIRDIHEYHALLFADFIFAANIKITIRDTSNIKLVNTECIITTCRNI